MGVRKNRYHSVEVSRVGDWGRVLPVGRGRTATEIGGELSECVNATDSVRPVGALAISSKLGMRPLMERVLSRREIPRA